MDKKKNILGISLSEEDRKKVLEEIVYYFETEREEKLGIIASQNIYDFFLDTLGKRIYNKALEDAKLWFDHRLEDLDVDFYSLYKQGL